MATSKSPRKRHNQNSTVVPIKKPGAPPIQQAPEDHFALILGMNEQGHERFWRLGFQDAPRHMIVLNGVVPTREEITAALFQTPLPVFMITVFEIMVTQLMNNQAAHDASLAAAKSSQAASSYAAATTHDKMTDKLTDTGLWHVSMDNGATWAVTSKDPSHSGMSGEHLRKGKLLRTPSTAVVPHDPNDGGQY